MLGKHRRDVPFPLSSRLLVASPLHPSLLLKVTHLDKVTRIILHLANFLRNGVAVKLPPERAEERLNLFVPGCGGEPERGVGGVGEDDGHAVVQLRVALARTGLRRRKGRTKESCLLDEVVMIVKDLKVAEPSSYLRSGVSWRSERRRREHALRFVPESSHHHERLLLGLRKVRQLLFPLYEPFVEPAASISSAVSWEGSNAPLRDDHTALVAQPAPHALPRRDAVVSSVEGAQRLLGRPLGPTGYKAPFLQQVHQLHLAFREAETHHEIENVLLRTRELANNDGAGLRSDLYDDP